MMAEWSCSGGPAAQECDRTGQLPAVDVSDCVSVKPSVHALRNTSQEDFFFFF